MITKAVISGSGTQSIGSRYQKPIIPKPLKPETLYFMPHSSHGFHQKNAQTRQRPKPCTPIEALNNYVSGIEASLPSHRTPRHGRVSEPSVDLPKPSHDNHEDVAGLA